MDPYHTHHPSRMDGICPSLGTRDKGRTPIVRLPLGTCCVGVLQGLVGTCRDVLHPSPPLNR